MKIMKTVFELNVNYLVEKFTKLYSKMTLTKVFMEERLDEKRTINS